MFRGIYKLPAGYRGFVVPDGTLRAERYWDALPGQGLESERVRAVSQNELREFAVARTLQLLDESIQKRMMSDVPFGVPSDSSSGATLCAEISTRGTRMGA